MKLYFKIALAATALTSIVVAGCLKDKDYDNRVTQAQRSNGAQRIIEVGITATATTNFQQIALPTGLIDDTSFQFFPINVVTGPASQDIHVTLALTPALIGDYNSLQDPVAIHEEAPASVYTITNPPAADGSGYIVTIPKGSTTGFLEIKLKRSDFLGPDYALGFQISKIDEPGYLISTNLGSGVTAIGIKNRWDGIYSYKGFSFRAGDASLTGNFSGKEMALITTGAAAVGFGSIPLWGDGNSGISIGNPNLALNTSSNVPPYPITITSSGGAVNGPGTPTGTMLYDSRYDSLSQSFYIAYAWGTGPTERLSVDTLTYLRPR